MSPKRAVFSLNINSESEHFDKHVTKHYPDGTDSVKVIGSKDPTHGYTSVTKPFERVVNQAVDDVLKDSGKKVDKVEGDLHYTSSTNTHTNTSSSSNSTSDSNLNVKNKSTRRYLERRYDTSDL